MYFLRVIGVVLLAVTLAGCTLSEKQYHDLRIVLKQRSDLRTKLQSDCVRRVHSAPRGQVETAAEFMDIKVATFPQAFCKRMYDAYIGGRLSYADYKDLMHERATPRIIRILRGKRP